MLTDYAKSISLLHYKMLDVNLLSELKEAKFSKVAVTPSLFISNLGSSREIIDKTFYEKVRQNSLEVTSIQGLLYGINPTDSKSLMFRKRLQILAEVSFELEIPLLVLGAPKFRRNKRLWKEILSFVEDFERSTNLVIGIENICMGNCSDFEPDKDCFDTGNFRRVLDLANYLECQSKEKLDWLRLSNFEYLHLSYLGHRLPRTEIELFECTNLLNNLASLPEGVWELDSVEPGALLSIRGALDSFE